MMKEILISQEKFHETVESAMIEYTDNMKRHSDDVHKYTRMMELADVLTMSVAFALLESSLFGKGGESNE